MSALGHPRLRRSNLQHGACPLRPQKRAYGHHRDRPRSRVTRPGPARIPEILEVSVADINPAEAAHPPPAARSNHHDAAEATSPVSVAVIATTHSTTLAATGGSLGRDECRGADSGDGCDSEQCLADHGSLLVFTGCLLASAPLDARMIRRVLRRAVL